MTERQKIVERSTTDACQTRDSGSFAGPSRGEFQPGEPDNLRTRRRDIRHDQNGAQPIDGLYGRWAARGACDRGHPLHIAVRVVSLDTTGSRDLRQMAQSARFRRSALGFAHTGLAIGLDCRQNCYGYRDDDAKHALVAKLYDLEMKSRPGAQERLPRLIDLGSSCYPSYTARSCWIVVARPRSEDDLDIAQDLGNWHQIRSNVLRGLMPAHVEYGEVALKRISEGAYSVLSHDYEGP